ncbi:MAG: sulfate transporter CysZ [Chromatiales bacterium]|jgi:CysZ protein|nr:sulfate transporter CysZ [Chromatiales bacterium]
MASTILANNPLTGALYFIKGLRLVFRPRLRRFVLMPLLINIVLFAVLIGFGASRFDGWVTELMPEGLVLFGWEIISAAVFTVLMWPIYAIVVAVAGFYTFAIVANLIASPFNGMLAQAVEEILTGVGGPDGPIGLGAIAKDAGIAIASEVRKMAYVVPRLLLLGLLFLVPVVQLAAPFIWFAFAAWLTAISYADFPMGNHAMGFVDQRKRVATRRFAALGFGGVVTLAIAIPVVNLIAIPAAVAGATVFWVDQLKDA